MLVISLATLPPILDSMAPGRLGSPAAGALGSWLAGHQQLLFSSWGALLVSGLLFLLGVLCVTGISSGRALAAAGSATAAVGVLAALVGRGTWSVVSRIAVGVSEIFRAAFRRARIASARVRLWREQRARRARAIAVEELEAALETGEDGDALSESDEAEDESDLETAERLLTSIDAFLAIPRTQWAEAPEIEIDEMRKAQLRALGYALPGTQGGREKRRKAARKNKRQEASAQADGGH